MREYKGKSIIALPSSYVAVDIETTGLDYEYCNIIEIAAVKYKDGQQVDVFSTLVKPPLERVFFPLRNDGAGEWVRHYVDDFIADLTGITNEMLENAPNPEIVIPEFLNFVGDSVVIGHNVSFDVNFIYDAAEKIGVSFCNDHIDTLRLARKLFPDLAHHRLPDICAACNVPQSSAHRAEIDCISTAQCYEYMRSAILSAWSEEDFARSFSMKRKNYKDSLSGVTATTEQIDNTNPIYGKVVVFTGALSSMGRKDAFQIVANLGGTPLDAVTKKTNYLVIGNADFAKSVKEGKTSKMKKAETLISKGEEVSILSENAFLDLISDYIDLK